MKFCLMRCTMSFCRARVTLQTQMIEKAGLAVGLKQAIFSNISSSKACLLQGEKCLDLF